MFIAGTWLTLFKNETTKTPIIFVCHCLGGIILEKALLTSRLRQNEFPTVYPWVAGSVFLGTPFHGTKTQSKAMVLAQMAETIGWGNPSSLLKMLESESDILKGLLDEFALLARDAQMRLFCFYEEDKSTVSSLFIKGGLSWTTSELIVDESSATITAVEKLPLRSDHFHLNKFEGPKDGNYKYVSEEIWITAQKAEGILKSRQNLLRQALVSDRTYHSMIDHLGKGFQDIDAAISGSYKGPKASKLSSVLELESFKQWRSSDSTQILWVHGKVGGQGTVASSAVEFPQRSREDDSIIVSFFCDESDRQRRSLRGLLQMIVRQIIDLDQDLARHILSDSRKGKDAGMQDFDPEESLKVPALWDALHRMTNDMITGKLYVIVYGLEQLAEDSLIDFLHYISEYPELGTAAAHGHSAPSLKWFILSRTGRPSIKKCFRLKALEVNLQDEGISARISDDLRTHISVSVDELHLPSSLAYFVKRHIHSRAADDWTYVNLVIQELKNAWRSGRTQHADIRKLLESFPYGLTNMFEHIRKRVLNPQADGYEYTKEVLRRLICAYVAPTLRELAVMAGFPSEDQEDIEKLQEYVIRCGAFLTMRGDDWDLENNTVEWIHVTAPEHLRQYAKDDLSLDLCDLQHGIIALRSLEYIYETINQYEARRAIAEAKSIDETELDAQDVSNENEDTDHKATETAETNEVDENDKDEDDHVTDADEQSDIATSVANDEDPENILDEMLKYPIQYWVEHAQRAPRDVLNEFNTDHSFWQDESELRQKCWNPISDVHNMPEQTDISPLHMAVILKFLL